MRFRRAALRVLIGLSAFACPLVAFAAEEEVVPERPSKAAVRITSVAMTTEIYPKAGRLGAPLGYLRIGGSLSVREPLPVVRRDCPAGWYAVEPRGFVCLDTTTVLGDPGRTLPMGADRFVRALATGVPRGGPLPFDYALSLGAPMYGRLPTEAEQSEREDRFGPAPAHPGRWARGHEKLLEPAARSAEEPAPWFFGGGEPSPVYVRGTDVRLVRKVAKRGSMISFVSSFETGGRTWLLTPDLTAVPADRVRAFRPTSFRGVALGEEIALPLAWVRWRPAAKIHKDADGRFAKSDSSWPMRAAVPLSGERVIDGGAAYLGTSEAGTFVAESSVVVVRTAKRRPPVVGPDEKWIQISISKGTLTAYQGEVPVFATLVSPGRGGVPQGMSVPVNKLAKDGSTPLGTYRIQYKDRFTVMSPDPEQKKYFVADVPHVQYFFGPFALHATYWHEDFGEPRSGGCVNLSPADAQWLFEWTDPVVPEGWQGARATGPNGPGTALQISP